MSFSQFFSVIRARWISGILVLSLIVGGVAIISLLVPKGYTASASVVLDAQSPDLFAGAAAGTIGTTTYISTQVDIIRSDRVARRVVESLKLHENPLTRQMWMESTQGKGDPIAWTGNLLQKRLEVTPSKSSNVITISFFGNEPKFAAVMANAFVASYIDVSVGLHAAPAGHSNDFFDARSKELRANLEQAQAKLSDYQKKYGILATDERYDIENQRLNELNSQLVTLQAMTSESVSRSRQARNASEQSQDVINNPVVSGIRMDMTRQEVRLQELRSRLGDEHPQVQEVRANLAELQARLTAETRRISVSVGAADTIPRQREADVRSALEAQRQKVLRLKVQHDEVSVLQRDVESAQRVYEQVVLRRDQTGLESQKTQTNISVLSEADEPTEASSPRIMLNILASLFAGTVAALITIFVREARDRRVRTLEDLSAVVHSPVLGILPHAVIASSTSAKSHMILPGNVVAKLPAPDR